MPGPGNVQQQIIEITSYLVEIGLADDLNSPIQRSISAEQTEVTFPGAGRVTLAMKNRPYVEIYGELLYERAYNLRMPDGALIQMMYLFARQNIEMHRLAFFSSPHLEEFQNNPDIYLEDAIYADVVSPNIVAFPLRFDFDSREEAFREIEHPRSHLSLGQYENCRIPVSSPITPFWFADFILRNFYHTAFLRYADDLPRFAECFDESIAASESQLIHVRAPRP
jgi:hypothetical protein